MRTVKISEKTYLEFFKRIDRRITGCWEWTGYCVKGSCAPYPEFALGKRRIGAHRLSYQLFKGPLDEKLEIDHLCRNTLCVNPEHLEQVTHRVNALRGVGVGAQNAKKTACINGHPFMDANVAFYKGRRICRECNRQAQARYKLRKAAELV